MDHSSLRSSADGACYVQGSCLWSSAGYDKRTERLELAVARIDFLLETHDPRIIDLSFCEMVVHLFEVGSREQRADRKQVALNWNQDFVDARHHFNRSCCAEECVQLVDVAV